MNVSTDSVHTVTISEITADTHQQPSAHGCRVYGSDELGFPQKMFRPVRAEHFTLLLVTAGTARVHLNLIPYTLSSSSLLVILPRVVHELKYKSDDFAFLGLLFTTDFLTEALPDKRHRDAFSVIPSLNSPYQPLSVAQVETLLPLLLLLGQKCGVAPTHPFGKEVIGHSFNLVLFELAAIMKSYRGDPFTKFTRKEDLLMGFIKLLTKHVKEQRSVQYYADQLFITPKHLSRTIKELTGKTCGELIDEMVITEAKVLLNDSALSIGNVAEELHFSDQFFFSKFFKHHTGLTPTEYRTSV